MCLVGELGPAGLAAVLLKMGRGVHLEDERVIGFRARSLELRFAGPTQVNVDGEVALRATARAAEPLALVLEVAKPRPTNISVHVSTKSIRGEILRIIGGVDGEIRRFTAAHVAAQIDAPESKEAQVIDVAGMIDSTWTGI